MSLQQLIERRDRFEEAMEKAKKDKNVVQYYRFNKLYHKTLRKLNKYEEKSFHKPPKNKMISEPVMEK